MGHWLPGFPPFSQFPAELVVHSLKWTTSSRLFPGFPSFSGFLAELVVHSSKWTTGSWLFPGFPHFSQFLAEPVVHSLKWTTGKWTTGSWLFLTSKTKKRPDSKNLSLYLIFKPSEQWFLNQSGRWRRDRAGRLRQRGSCLPQSLGLRRPSQFAVGPHCLPSRQWLSRRWTRLLFP